MLRCYHTHLTYITTCIQCNVMLTPVQRNANPNVTYTVQCYRWAELDKKRKYNERICEVERGTFSPLVFPILVTWIPQLQFFTNATLISEKRSHPYCHMSYWLRCRLFFLLLLCVVNDCILIKYNIYPIC